MPYDQFGNYTPYPYPTRQPQSNVYAFVNGVEGAKSYIVQPNQTVLLMDSEQPVCYMKTANGLGQGSLRYFKLLEVTENDLRKTVQQQTTEYVTKDDFKTVLERLEKLEGNKHE